jgi:hypothetical protein
VAWVLGTGTLAYGYVARSPFVKSHTKDELEVERRSAWVIFVGKKHVLYGKVAHQSMAIDKK